MEAKRKRRRILFPTLATMAGLAASGWAAVEFDALSGLLPQTVQASADHSATSDNQALDAIEQAWAEQQLSGSLAELPMAWSSELPPATH